VVNQAPYFQTSPTSSFTVMAGHSFNYPLPAIVDPEGQTTTLTLVGTNPGFVTVNGVTSIDFVPPWTQASIKLVFTLDIFD
jgi:uncharacterized repeat protein (TIGR01451 family)